jgi:AI-2 transport protein TqsA
MTETRLNNTYPSNRLQKSFYWLVILFLLATILVIGKNFIQPFVLALFIWYLINTLSYAFMSIKIGSKNPPAVIAYLLSVLTIFFIIFLLVRLIQSNVSQVISESGSYQEKFTTKMDRIWIAISTKFKIEKVPEMERVINSINLKAIINKTGSAMTGILSKSGLILAYTIFLFLEQGHMRKKIDKMFPDTTRRSDIRKIIARIQADVRTYIGIKTAVSLVTAILSYIVMRAIKLDFAAFWAVLIFIFNFIPNIGSLIATILPATLALVQFDSLKPFLVVVIGITGVQLLMGNLIEPRLMGGSLNLSPLVIILSLVLWGTLWGIVGMFLCVPITVVLTIILSHFPQSRPIAILLSQDGRIRHD